MPSKVSSQSLVMLNEVKHLAADSTNTSISVGNNDILFLRPASRVAVATIPVTFSPKKRFSWRESQPLARPLPQYIQAIPRAVHYLHMGEVTYRTMIAGGYLGDATHSALDIAALPIIDIPTSQ